MNIILLFVLLIIIMTLKNISCNKILHKLTKSLSYTLTEKGSKFIVLAQPVENIKECNIILEDIRKKYNDASHNCWAYSSYGGYDRSSDDGEPTNSAGKPILQSIKTSNIANCLVIVTRYFGGIELGVGGLIRAYSSSSKNCLQQASLDNGLLELIIPSTEMQISASIDEIGTIYQILNSEQQCKRLNEKFVEEKGTSKMIINIEIENSRLEALKSKLIDRCKGKVQIVAYIDNDNNSDDNQKS